MINIEKIIPHIPSNNLKVTQAFFVANFEFIAIVGTEYYIELKNTHFTLGLLEANGELNEQSIYIQVKDIEVLWKNIKSNLTNYKYKELFTRHYGMKEFHVIVPETKTLLIVGEPVNV